MSEKSKINPEWEKATHRLVTSLPAPREIWSKCVQEAVKEVPEIRDNREAIRSALRESRRRHTVKVRSVLP